MRTCEVCGAEFEGTSRARFCGGTCRKRNHDRQQTPGTPGLVTQVRRELERLGKLESLEGAQALQVAERMESPTESGSAVAALSRDLSRLIQAVRASSAPVEDEVAVARRQREEKLARVKAAGKTQG